jgi:hypothetical protein
MWASVRWRRLVRRTRKIERDRMVVVVMQWWERVGGVRGLDGNQGIWYGFLLSFNSPNLRSDMPISISSIHCSLTNLRKPLSPPPRGLCISDHWNPYSFQCHLHRRQAGLSEKVRSVSRVLNSQQITSLSTLIALTKFRREKDVIN